MTGAVPTLSHVRRIDTAYLVEAARSWTKTAHLWEQTFAGVHDRMSSPGGTPWTGEAAVAARQSSYLDLVKVRGASDQLHGAADVARRGVEQLRACKEAVLEAVEDAHADGFDVGDDYSVTDRVRGGGLAFRTARRAAADGHASFILHRVAALVASDQQLATRLTSAISEIDALTFPEGPGVDDTVVGDDDGRNTVRAVDLHTFKEAPNPEPDPPPGGWSSDPLMRAAQKIAYGHAFADHSDDFAGLSKDQLADLIYSKMERSINNPEGLRLGASRSDGAPVIYDPKDNVLIIRDPAGADCGTVFKPNLTRDPEIVNNKFGWNEPSFKPDQLADRPHPLAVPAEPRPAPVPAEAPAPRSPVEPPGEPLKPGPGVGKGGGGMPGLLFGGGIPWDSPATGPHPVHPHHPGQHHRMPLLGELPDDYEE